MKGMARIDETWRLDRRISSQVIMNLEGGYFLGKDWLAQCLE